MIIFQWPFVVVAVNVKWCTKFIMIFFFLHIQKKNEQESLCEKLKNQERERKKTLYFIFMKNLHFLSLFFFCWHGFVVLFIIQKKKKKNWTKTTKAEKNEFFLYCRKQTFNFYNQLFSPLRTGFQNFVFDNQLFFILSLRRRRQQQQKHYFWQEKQNRIQINNVEWEDEFLVFKKLCL